VTCTVVNPVNRSALAVTDGQAVVIAMATLKFVPNAARYIAKNLIEQFKLWFDCNRPDNTPS
jgi:hypothetical protein